MSHEAALEFVQTIGQDEALTKRFSAISDPAEVAKIAESELGYNFTPEELKDVFAKIKEFEVSNENGELSDAQLETVAGGAWWPPSQWGKKEAKTAVNVVTTVAGWFL